MKTKSHKICHGPVPFRYTEYVCSFDVFYLMFALSVDSDATPVDSRDPPVDSAFLRLIHSTLQLIFSQSGRFRDTPVDISSVRLIHSTLRLIFPLSGRFRDTPVDISSIRSIPRHSSRYILKSSRFARHASRYILKSDWSACAFFSSLAATSNPQAAYDCKLKTQPNESLGS